MASLPEEQLFQICDQGPAPAKDFYQLAITKHEVIFRTWKISLRLGERGTAPIALKTTHHDFLHHKRLQEQVGAVFGPKTLEYAVSLCQGNFNYLDRLPDDILLRILSFLDLKDTTLLAQVSHRFRTLCNSEKFWEHTVRNRCAEFTNDMDSLANALGWRKMYFTWFYRSGRKMQ
ncbi:F-box only protein 36a [Halichoeres trimaculatus]|uniref:F-box only protein 36a n=1 Tax=Halichoeres trimaculatus TaxID=147232 RepID=UPI003D9EF380